MNKQLFSGLLCGSMVFGMAGQASANLLTNGSFESGLDNWWARNFGGDQTTSSTDAATDGLYSLKIYQPNGAGWTALGQDLSSTIDINSYYNFRVDYMTTINQHGVYFAFTNYNFAPFGHASNFLNIDNPIADGQWHTVNAVISPSNMSQSFQSLAIYNDYGSPHGPTTIYFDNIQVDPIPEPATILLFCTGIAGLAGARFKKKKQ